MADEQASEIVRELRKIRYLLAGILLLLALTCALRGYLRWAETHYGPSARSQEFHDNSSAAPEDAGLLVQEGNFSGVTGTGDFEVNYCKPYAQPPQLTFPTRNDKWVSWEMKEQKATGFTIHVSRILGKSEEELPKIRYRVRPVSNLVRGTDHRHLHT